MHLKCENCTKGNVPPIVYVCWLLFACEYHLLITFASRSRLKKMFDTLIWYYLLKNSLKELILGKISRQQNNNQHTLHAKKLERCATAIKTNGPLNILN